MSDRELRLSAPGVYALTVPLPYRVDDGAAAAKFDKTARRLTVTLPLAPLTADEVAALRAQARGALESSVSEDAVAPKQEGAALAAIADPSSSTSPTAVASSAPSVAALPAASAPASAKAPTPPVKASAAAPAPASAPAAIADADKSGKDQRDVRPPFSMRQTAAAVTLVLRVSNVEPRSVRLQCTETSIDLVFSCSSPARHFRLACALAGRVVAAKCTHALSTKNFVVTLAKAEAGVEWPQLEGAGELSAPAAALAAVGAASPSAPVPSPASVPASDSAAAATSAMASKVAAADIAATAPSSAVAATPKQAETRVSASAPAVRPHCIHASTRERTISF